MSYLFISDDGSERVSELGKNKTDCKCGEENSWILGSSHVTGWMIVIIINLHNIELKESILTIIKLIKQNHYTVLIS